MWADLSYLMDAVHADSLRPVGQVIEMLEYASNTRDKTVDIDAFSRIMVDVKAV